MGATNRARVLAALIAGATLTTSGLAGTPAAQAMTPSIISNGVIQIGVNPAGQLNVYEGSTYSSEGTLPTGLRYLPTNAESTAPGCLCEGWGVGDTTSGVSGWANEAQGGTYNLTPVSFTVTAETAVSVVRVGETFEVTHDYHPAPETTDLYEVDVTIKNISAADADLRYRRVMDWDIEPTAFAEYVTLDAGNASDLVYTSNDGFASSDPLSGPSDIGYTGSFTDAGPADHGALFDFAFGSLAPGASKSFTTFYGGSANEENALAALAAVGAEAYSFGQPSTADGPSLGTPNTFIFAFGKVGGDPIYGCGEDGVDAFTGTPLEGLVSDTVHTTVEPAVAGLSADLGAVVHQVNCDVVVPVENEVDALLAG